MKIILSVDSHLRTATGLERVGRLEAGAELATPNGVSGVRRIHRCLPPTHSIEFDSESLFPGGPVAPLRLGVETLLGFRNQQMEIDMAAAAGLVNGTSIRREAWPRRTPAVLMEVDHPVQVEGVWVGAPGLDTISDGAIWAGPSILRWRYGTSDPNSVEFDRSQDDEISAQTAPVRLMSDGFWAKPLSYEQFGDDFVMRFSVPASTRWVRIISSALRPAGLANNEADLRRFGIAVGGRQGQYRRPDRGAGAICQGRRPRFARNESFLC